MLTHDMEDDPRPGKATAEAPARATITIENVRFGDIPALKKIQDASFRRSLAYGYVPLYTLWLAPFVTFLVARGPDGDPVGCLIADRYQGHIRIMNIAVAPSWRRRGVGRALLRAIDARLPGGNIVLMVEEHNEGAQALYRDEGYTRTGFERNYYGPMRHGIEMTLHR